MRGSVLAGLLVAATLAGGAASAQPSNATRADPASIAAQVAERTNRFRGENGLAPLSVDDRLARAAQRFADFMAERDAYGHEADGRSASDRARAQGYDYCIVAENIAFQFSSAGFASADLAARLVEGWEQSPGHRANMLRPQVVDTGIGVAQSRGSQRWYAVQMFGRPRSAASRFELVNRSDAVIRYEIDAKTLTLEPRVSRTHQGCFTGELRLTGPDGAIAGVVQPRDGARYVVQRAGSGPLRVQAVQP